MKIALLANSAYSMANFRSGVISAMISGGHNVFVISPNDDYVEDLNRIGAKHLTLNFSSKSKNPLRDLILLLGVLRIYHKVKPNIIFQYTIKPNIYGSICARILGIKNVVAIIPGLGSAFGGGVVLKKIAIFLYGISLRHVKEVWFLNNDDMNSFVNNKIVHENRCFVLDGEGVDIDYFSLDAGFDRSFKLCGDVNFLYLGRLLDEKGIRDYVRAAEVVREVFPAARFYVMGSPDGDNPSAISSSELKQWIANGFIDYIEPRKDVRPVLFSCDCVVLPSYYREGVPRALLEGASLCRPLIAANNVGSNEVVVDGVTGFVCEARNHNSLAQAMINIIAMDKSSRIAMGKAGRKVVVERFAESVIIEKYSNFISRCEK